jgi:DNA-binding transcriptional LysR family regulator
MTAGRLDLNLVRVFVAIYETRSVTLAAARLDLTQPTVSHSLARLRDAYGDRLFVRSGQGLAPTARSEQLFEQLAESLSIIDASLEEQRPFEPSTSSRRYRLAMSDIGALYFVPPLLRRFQQVAPRLQMEVAQHGEGVLEELAAGRLDVAIGNLPGLATSTRSEPLFREHYACLLSAEHPSITGDAMTLAEFAAARHIMVTSPSSGHGMVDRILAQQGISRNVVARVPQFTVLPQLLAQSDLVVILPSRMAELYAAQGGLKALPLPVAIAEFEVRLHWHARQNKVPSHRWLREEIIAALSAL